MSDFMLTPKDILEVLHRQIHYQQVLIANRMTWYVTSQSFLMTAFAIAGGSGHNFQWLAKGLIPSLGITISIIIWFALDASLDAMIELRRHELHLLSSEEGLRKLPFADSQDALTHPQLQGRLPLRIMPILFLSAWVIATILVWTVSPNF